MPGPVRSLQALGKMTIMIMTYDEHWAAVQLASGIDG